MSDDDNNNNNNNNEALKFGNQLIKIHIDN